MVDAIGAIMRGITGIFKWWILVMPWERGLRVRCGRWIKELQGGIHFRIPYFDAVYVQTIRLRVVAIPMQTIQTNDNKPLTIVAALGYKIVDVRRVYEALYHPESTVVNMVMGEIASFIACHSANECSPKAIEIHVVKALDLKQYGFDAGYVRIVGYTMVKTYRLIQANHYTDISDSIDVDEKR